MSTPKIKDVEPDITPEEEKAILDIGGDPGDYEAARTLYAYADSIRKERDVKWSAAAEEVITAFEKMNNDFDDGIEITEKTYRRYAKARDVLQGLIEEVK